MQSNLSMLYTVRSDYLSEPGSTDGATPERVKVLEVLRHPDPVGVHMLLDPGNQLSHVHLRRRIVGGPGGGVWGARGEGQQSNILLQEYSLG